jgi:GNAT superfamily N-acetyltransferase
MEILVRRAVPADIESVLPLVQAYRMFYRRSPDETAERAFILGHLRDGSSAVFLAFCDEHAVGFVQLFTSWSTVYLAPVAILEDLFVEEAFRKRGVATKLLNAALNFAREAGAATMFLETAADNLRAQEVYERNGWLREARFLKYNAPI